MIYEERDYRIRVGKLGEFVRLYGDGLLDVQSSRILAPVAYSPLQ